MLEEQIFLFRIGRIIGFRAAYRIARLINNGRLPLPDYEYSAEKALHLARMRLYLPYDWRFSYKQLKKHARNPTIDRYTAFGAVAFILEHHYYPAPAALSEGALTVDDLREDAP